jgi:hypothetical protein
MKQGCEVSIVSFRKTDGEHSIPGREMKCQDPWWTERGESDVLVGIW